jgi:hypothetical protein
MVDLHFGDGEALRGGEDRNETVELAMDADFFNHFAAVALEAAVVVVQTHSGEASDDPIEDARGDDFVPRIETLLLPAADDVGAGFELA